MTGVKVNAPSIKKSNFFYFCN